MDFISSLSQLAIHLILLSSADQQFSVSMRHNFSILYKGKHKKINLTHSENVACLQDSQLVLIL